MSRWRMAVVPLIALALPLAAASLVVGAGSIEASSARCTLVPGATLALLRVERDTTLPHVPGGSRPASATGGPPSPRDSILAVEGTPMPAARVRLLRVDSATRAALAAQGVAAGQSTAYIRAAPYRADCRTVRWTGESAFTVAGDTGYVRATLAPRGQWVDGVPVLIVFEAWAYPYPRRRSLAFGATPDQPLASAAAMFDLSLALDIPEPRSAGDVGPYQEATRARGLAWARANPAAAELEPVRTMVRRAVLDADWAVVTRAPSRLRGTYRVELELEGERHRWFFRTHDRAAYGWPAADSVRTTAELIASPHVAGYALPGYAAAALDSLPDRAPTGSLRVPLAWLASDDRPTTPGNAARRELKAMLQFRSSAVAEPLWAGLEPPIPLTVRLDGRGEVRADTTLLAGGRRVRVRLERVDTLAVTNPF